MEQQIIYYKNLWASVLDQAIFDIRSHSKINQVYSNQAIAWLNSTNTKIKSFIWICTILNLNPDIAREKILNNIKSCKLCKYLEDKKNNLNGCKNPHRCIYNNYSNFQRRK